MAAGVSRKCRPQFSFERSAAESGVVAPRAYGHDHIRIHKRPGKIQRTALFISRQIGSVCIGGWIKLDQSSITNSSGVRWSFKALSGCRWLKALCPQQSDGVAGHARCHELIHQRGHGLAGLWHLSSQSHNHPIARHGVRLQAWPLERPRQRGCHECACLDSFDALRSDAVGHHRPLLNLEDEWIVSSVMQRDTVHGLSIVLVFRKV